MKHSDSLAGVMRRYAHPPAELLSPPQDWNGTWSEAFRAGSEWACRHAVEHAYNDARVLGQLDGYQAGARMVAGIRPDAKARETMRDLWERQGLPTEAVRPVPTVQIRQRVNQGIEAQARENRERIVWLCAGIGILGLIAAAVMLGWGG